MHLIPVFKPLIEEEEIKAATDSLRLGWLGMGASVGEFEHELKKFIGCADRHVVAVNTGHSALHLAMMLIGLKPGDEVITPSFNNIADFQAIIATGAKPVFCDIDENSLCIDLTKAEQLITSRTKAMIVMDYDCCIADHEKATELAEKYNLRIIHDAAHSFGSFYKDKKIGTFSDICMFSFDPVKTITCIDGGALIVKNENDVKILHEMRLIGMGQPASVMYGNSRAWTYDVKRLGFRYHMANLHAAIGLQQLKKMDLITSTRQQTCKLYNQLLSSIPQIITPISDFEKVTPFLYYIRVPSKSRKALIDYLKCKGIDTGIHWQPGHLFELFSQYSKGDLSVTEKIGEEILSLPLHSNMNEDEVKLIVAEIKAFYESHYE